MAYGEGNTEDRARLVIQRFQAAKQGRGNWESQWEDIAATVLPSYAGSFQGDGMNSDGQRRTEQMFDATAALALPKFAAAMESMLTPRNSTWHRLVPREGYLLRNRAVRMWYDEVNEALFKYRYAPRANYASQQHEIYMGLGAFGTGALYIDKLDQYEAGLRYSAIHLGELYFLCNHQGIIDTALRRFPLSPRQAVQQFGTNALPDDVVEKADKPDQGKQSQIFVIHMVAPRDGFDPGRLDAGGQRFESCYVLESNSPKLLKEGGYHTFPYAISRYVVAPGETYGRSPAMLALPAIKVLNEQKKTLLKQGHRVVDPVLLAHDDGVLSSFSLKPGAVNFGGVNAQGQVLVHPLPTGNLSLAKEMMESERLVINDAFLVTLFQILIETPQMTATEVLERAREKGALLSPTMGRQQSEALSPMIERELDVLAAQGLLPPMPDILKQAQAYYETVYDSPLSRAQRAEQASGLLHTVNWARDIVAVTQDPAPLDYFNWDQIMPDLADINAVPAKWINDQNIVAALRDQRAKAAAMKQMTEAAPAMAGVARAMPQLLLHGQAAAGGMA